VAAANGDAEADRRVPAQLAGGDFQILVAQRSLAVRVLLRDDPDLAGIGLAGHLSSSVQMPAPLSHASLTRKPIFCFVCFLGTQAGLISGRAAGP
jgi:hypothetical protein